MYYVKAMVSNTFYVPANSEKGYAATYKVQLLGEQTMQDGQIRQTMIDLSVTPDVYDDLQGKQGQEVTLPIGFFVNRGQLVSYYPKGAELSADQQAGSAS